MGSLFSFVSSSFATFRGLLWKVARLNRLKWQGIIGIFDWTEWGSSTSQALKFSELNPIRTRAIV